MDNRDEHRPPAATLGPPRVAPAATAPRTAPTTATDARRRARAVADAVEAIPVAVRRCETANASLVCVVAQARRAGASWAVVGSSLGVSRQAAWERFAHQVGPSVPDARLAR